MEILKQFLDLNIAIHKEFNPLNWVDITNYENGTGSVSFTDDGESEDVFFNKMYKIKEFDFPYSEATININFNGGEL